MQGSYRAVVYKSGRACLMGVAAQWAECLDLGSGDLRIRGRKETDFSLAPTNESSPLYKQPHSIL